MAAGRAPCPSLVIMDGQSVKTTERGGVRGFDDHKLVKGRKRHILVGTLGLPIASRVEPACVPDQRAGARLLDRILVSYGFLDDPDVPAALRLVDIAGIVKGASVGEGLGNKFLSHIREVDAILQVVRCFTKAPGGEDIVHVAGTVDPIRDIEIIATELILADLQTVDGSIGKAERAAKSGKPEDIARYEVLKKLKPVLERGDPAREAMTATRVA